MEQYESELRFGIEQLRELSFRYSTFNDYQKKHFWKLIERIEEIRPKTRRKSLLKLVKS